MITKHIRTLIISFILFGLTSSCEDKDRQSFGKVNLTFDYQETVEATNTSSEDSAENKTVHDEPSQDELEREQTFIKDRERSEPSLEIDVFIDENEDLIERSSELKQDYCCARIQINNGTPLTLDLSSQNTYSRTVPIGSTLINVDLLTFSNIVLYNAVKNVQVNEDVNTSVSFLPSDWVVQNQVIEITSDFNSVYSVGDNIPITWTNTHSARGVKIEMIQSTTANVVKILENNFIGNSYTFDTTNESTLPKNNVGIMVTSTLNETKSSRCCFDIVPPNDAPTVENISESVDEDSPIVITLDGSDGDNDSLTFSIVNSASNGTLNWLNGTQLRYTPNSNYNGSDSFTYKANDGSQDSNIATVTITVQAVNDAPTTNDVSTTIDENRIARVADLTLDGNDVDGDNLTYSLSTSPSNGSASINGNILTYNADQDWNGVETFTYLANDGELDSNISTITITVNPVNDDPVVTVGEVNTQSLYLDGDDSFTVFNDSELQNITDFAISLWVNFDDDGRWDGLLSKGYLENVIGLTIRRANDNNKIRISQSDAANNFVNILDSNSPILANSGWNHIVVQREDTLWEIYINGNNEGSVDFGSSEPQSFNSTADFVFAKGNGTTEYLKGYLDDIALYKTTLTDSEISSFSENGNWKSAALINSSNLMFYYQLNGDVVDSTSNNRNASNNGADFSNEVPGTNSPISIETDEDLHVDINLSEYVTDVDGDDLTFEVVSSAQNGTTTFISSNVIRYQPNSDYNGQDSFTWRASDGSAQTNEATVNIIINPINDAPTTGGGKTYSTPKDTVLNITLSGNDIDGDALSYEIEDISTSGNANLTLNGNVLTFAPSSDPSTNLKTQLQYKVSDGNLESEPSTIIVWIIANEFNSPTSDTYWKKGNTETISWTEQFDSPSLFLIKNKDYSNAITITGDYSTKNVDYSVPTTLENGDDYQILIAQSAAASGQYHFSDYFSIGDNSRPTANSFNLIAAVNTPQIFNLEGFDEDGDALSYIIVDQPVDGTISGIDSSVLDDNSGIYTPNTNNTGVDSFTYKVNDNSLDSEIATVLIGISNSPPSISDWAIELDEDNIFESYLPDLVDSDGDTLTYALVNGSTTNGNNGSIVISDKAKVTFTPNDDWYGNDYFIVRPNDRMLDGNDVRVDIEVDPIDDPPYVSNPSYSTNEDVSINFGRNTGYYASWGGDIDSGQLTIDILQQPLNGDLVKIGAGGTNFDMHYVPDEDFFGSDSIKYQLTNRNPPRLTSETGTIMININAVNDAPKSQNFTISTDKNIPFSINIIENTDYTDVHGNGPNFVTDVDTDLSELSAMFNDGTTATKTFNEGTMTFNNNVLTYVPTENWTGQENSFVQYKVFDGELYSNVEEGNDGNHYGLISVIVTNNAPVSSDVSVSTEQNLVKSITFDATDINGDNLTYSAVSNPSNGTLGNINGNTILYTPNNNWFGTDSFTYKANDGTADSNVSTVTITVNKSATTTDNYQPNGSDFSMPQREYFELPFTINDQGEITDINIDISFTHGYPTGLDQTKMYLLSPNLTLLKFFDFQDAEKQLLNTTFDDEADDNFSDGSNPFIGSFKPFNNLSVFDGEDLNGEWKLIIRNNNSTSGAVLNSFKLQITRINDSSGTTYNEDYSDFTIYDDTDRSFPQNITSVFTIPFGEYISSGSVVDDFHIELSVKHGYPTGLDQLKIAFDDNVSTSSLRKVFDFDKLSGDDILKLRFTNNNNDPSYDTINENLYTRVRAEESWTNFANTKPDSLRFYVTNNNSTSGLVIDDIKIYGKEKIASGNSYGATSLYFTANSAIGQTHQVYRSKSDGSSDFVENDFSYSAWIKPESLPGTGFIFSQMKEQGNGRWFSIGIGSDGAIKLYVKPDFTANQTIYESTNPKVVLGNNQWQHVAVTYDYIDESTTNISFYIDGAQVTSLQTSNNGDLSNIDGYMVLGTFQTGNPSNQYYGKIDEVAVFNSHLSSNAIQDLYNNGKGKDNILDGSSNYNANNVTGYWRLNEGSGSVANDSQNSNHLDNMNTHQQSGGSFDEDAIWSTE